MPKEPEVIKEFKQCPSCGSSMTLAKYLRENKPGFDQMVAFRMETKAHMQENPMLKLSTFTVPVIITNWDICFDCGEEYCTLIQIAEGRGTTQPMSGQPIPPGGGLLGSS